MAAFQVFLYGRFWVFTEVSRAPVSIFARSLSCTQRQRSD